MRPKRILLCILAILFLVALPTLWSRARSLFNRVDQLSVNAPHAKPGRHEGLRLVCYNIAHTRGLVPKNWNGEPAVTRLARIDRIAELLTETDADVVVLNEVDFDCSWSHHVDQAEQIALKAGYPYVARQRNVEARFLGWTWNFGNAVLSRYPLRELQPLEYPPVSAVESFIAGRKRGMVCVVHHPKQPFRIVPIHLSHRSETIRCESIEILTTLAKNSGLPVIFAGDFNSTPEGFPNHQKDEAGRNAIELIDKSEAFLRRPIEAPSEPQLTFTSESPHQLIDWIVIPDTWTFNNYQAIDTQLSDHRPVVTDIAF